MNINDPVMYLPVLLYQLHLHPKLHSSFEFPISAGRWRSNPMATALLKRTWTPHRQQQQQQQQQQLQHHLADEWITQMNGSGRMDDEGLEGSSVEVRDQGNGNVKVRSGSDVPHLVSLGSGRLSTSITLLPLPEQGSIYHLSFHFNNPSVPRPQSIESPLNRSWWGMKIVPIEMPWNWGRICSKNLHRISVEFPHDPHKNQTEAKEDGPNRIPWNPRRIPAESPLNLHGILIESSQIQSWWRTVMGELRSR